jgi:hypothetical protein
LRISQTVEAASLMPSAAKLTVNAPVAP